MIAQPSAPSAPDIRSEQASDDTAIEALLDHAFGPGRFVKVSERVREIAEFRPELSFCAWDGARLVGSVRMWKVHIGATPAISNAVFADCRTQDSVMFGRAEIDRCVPASPAPISELVAFRNRPTRWISCI